MLEYKLAVLPVLAEDDKAIVFISISLSAKGVSSGGKMEQTRIK